MDFAVSTFLLSWLTIVIADFLDASFLMTVAFTMYSPCCGFRDNESFWSFDRFLVFAGCSLALALRVFLLFCGIDPLTWDSYCHVGAAMMLLVFSVEVIIKWRRAVYGRSQFATALGRRLPEERMSASSQQGQLEDGTRPLALTNEPQTASNCAADGSLNTVDLKRCSFKLFMEKSSHFLIPCLLVLCVSARDASTQVSEKLAHDRIDMALGEAMGLLCSTLMAVLLGAFLKWYLHDKHLLFYISFVFLLELVMSVQGSVVTVFMKDLPKATEILESDGSNAMWM